MDENCITFLWKIENVRNYLLDLGESLQSPEFFVNSLSESAWEIRTFPSFVTFEDQITVQLHSNSYRGNYTLFIDYDISFLSAEGSVLATGKVQNQGIIPGKSYMIVNYPTYGEVFKNREEEFLPEGTLTIRCRIWKSSNSLTNSMQLLARTRIRMQKRSFHWAISNFSQLRYDEERTRIVKIGRNQPTFLIKLFLISATCQDFFGVNIRQLNAYVPKLFSFWKISVLNALGNVIKCDEKFFSFYPRGLPSFFTHIDLTPNTAGCLFNDTLNLLFELKFSNGLENSIESASSLPPWIQSTFDAKENTVPLDIAQRKNSIDSVIVSDQSNDISLAIFQMDLLSLYHDKILSDFKLHSGSVSFPVHKSVLAARSPVFKAMFSSDMREGSADFVDIPDVDADTLDRLLKFIYTGNGAILDCKTACNLYYAADKYEILTLKQKCSSFLASNIIDSKVCEILLLANRHNDESLKLSVHDFIVLNDCKIVSSIEWKQFLVSNPLLAAETMQLVYSRKLDMLSSSLKLKP